MTMAIAIGRPGPSGLPANGYHARRPSATSNFDQSSSTKDLRQQPQHERPRPAPQFHPHKPACDLGHQFIEQSQPPARVYAWLAATARSSRVSTTRDDQPVAAPRPGPHNQDHDLRLEY
jgi:hypothetical protein